MKGHSDTSKYFLEDFAQKQYLSIQNFVDIFPNICRRSQYKDDGHFIIQTYMLSKILGC